MLAEEGSPMILAEINCDGAAGIAQEFGIEGYPTIKYFRQGVARDYTGSRQVSTISCVLLFAAYGWEYLPTSHV